MTTHDDAITLLEAENKVLYDQIETIESSIKWCVLNRAMISFFKGVTVTIWRENKIFTQIGETLLDTVDDLKKQLAEQGEAPYANSD